MSCVAEDIFYGANCHKGENFWLDGRDDLVLVVDDDHETLSLLFDYFNVKGVPTSCFTSSALAIAQLTKAHEHTPEKLDKIKAIVLDLTMPEVSGFDFLDSLKSMGLTTPTIVITSMTDRLSEVQAIQKGAFAFLPKPFSLQNLLGIIRRV